MGPHDRDQLDDLLDDALKEYGRVELRAGTERSVLANLARLDRQSRVEPRWMVWALPLAGTVGMAIVLLFLMRTPHWHQQPIVVHLSSAAVQTGALKAATTTTYKSDARVARRPRMEPETAKIRRPNEFPSPHPLTEQERLLKNYVNNFPHEAALVAHEQAEREKELADRGWKSTETAESN